MAQTSPSISIALCTYNGARFLGEQLDSFARQTKLPAEVVLCDDGSTDNTVDIATEFARKSPFDMRIVRNEVNLGVARNFGQAMGLCSGDIIALSDQDDVWREDKLAIVASAFDTDPALSLIFTDADLVDDRLQPIGKRLSDTGHIDEAARAALGGDGAFGFLLRRNVATGATIALRSTLRDLVLPIPEGLLTYHDAWIVPLAAATSKIAFLPEPLMQYRQHPGQHTWDFVYVHGAKRVLDRAYYKSHLRQLAAMRDRLQSAQMSDANRALLDGYVAHLRRRATLPTSRLARLGPVLTELWSGRYNRYSSGLRSAARDLTAPA